jgi:hypothetical protein
VFFDASGTTDSAVKTSVSQDVRFSWSFGDGGASGTGKWVYGSNAGANSTNAGNGIVAAHLYRTAGSDQSYTATVTANDGTNTASCSLGVTAYEPNGPNGFPGAATTCISSSSTPLAGSGGCPAGANVLRTSSIETALSNAYGNGRRLLFKCGDTFSGDTTSDNLTAVKWAIGAYGGCQDTQTNRPIFSNSGADFIFQFGGTNGEGTLSDFDCEGNHSGTGGCIWADTQGVMYQDTIYNAYSNGEAVSYNWAQCSQCGVVQVVQNGMGPGSTQIGSYFNFSGYAGYPYSGNPYNNIYYQAVIGSHFDGGLTYQSTNAETVRISACGYCYIADNDMLNAGPSYAVLKIHQGNNADSVNTWIGAYTQYVEISDNLFGGTSGAYCTEIAPQNDSSNEHLRYIVVERNVFYPGGTALSTYCGHNATQLLIAGQYITARDNVLSMPVDGAWGIVAEQRGIEPAPTNIEVYNNSVQAVVANTANLDGILLSSQPPNADGGTNPSNSYVQNNLCYFPAQLIPCASVLGAGNTVSNNTSTATDDPAFTNTSGTFKKLIDWKPTANYSGGVKVPNLYDALGLPWAPTWDLGAVHP